MKLREIETGLSVGEEPKALARHSNSVVDSSYCPQGKSSCDQS
jgi:hypothetical protein